MASLSEAISSFLGGGGNGNNGSRPFKNRKAALEVLFAETEQNLEALARNTPLSSAAWDRLAKHNQQELLQDSNGTAYAAQQAYREVQSYASLVNTYWQMPEAERAGQADAISAKQVELLQRLQDLKWRLRQAYR